MYDKEKWLRAADFHGHQCPGLAIGYKAVEAALAKRPTGAAQDEEIVCVTENDTCAADAVQALMGCTFGKGNLVYRPRGKMAFSFYFRASGERLRVCFKDENSQNLDRAAYIDYLLNAPVESLFTFSTPEAPCPERARHFASVACSQCGEKAREDKIRLKDGKPYCLACFDEYDR